MLGEGEEEGPIRIGSGPGIWGPSGRRMGVEGCLMPFILLSYLKYPKSIITHLPVPVISDAV